MHLLPPYEFHANTTELIQMLEKGHHNVSLSDEAKSRLYAWIDLHAPYHGNWVEIVDKAKVTQQKTRRIAIVRETDYVDRRRAGLESD